MNRRIYKRDLANFQENTITNNVTPNIGQHVTELRNVHIDILN